jgi:hypothetical protein
MNPPFLWRILALATFGFVNALAATEPRRELITCGREKVLILDLNSLDAAGTPKILWTWQAEGRAELPAEYRSLFRSTDECRPVEGGRRILIASSGGAVALVNRATGHVDFYGRAVNAHSADLLPRGRIAVASSRDPRDGKGDSLILFDVTQPGRELWRTDLPSGHGVVWDEQRQSLWALSDEEIRIYRISAWNTDTPRLLLDQAVRLPEAGGHDLSPVPGTAFLSVTTNGHCWLFDRDSKKLTRHPLLGDRAAIKCIGVHPATGEIAYTEAERPNWWTTRIRFINPENTCSVSGEQFYKVRWNVP